MNKLTLENLLENFICFDYETKDPHIGKSMGAGWVFALNYPELENNGFTIGVGSYNACSDSYAFADEIDIYEESVLVGQNLIYDLGWYLATHALDKQSAIDILRDMCRKGVALIDTRILAKLVDEHKMSYSLASLTKEYKVTQKSTDLLADAVFDSGLYSNVRSTEDRKFTKRPKDNKQLLKIAYENMDKLPKHIVTEYCLDDVKGTVELYRKFINILRHRYGEQELIKVLKTYSTLQYAVMEMRINGIAIDNNKLKENHRELCRMLGAEQSKLNELVGMEVHTAATASIIEALKAYGYNENNLDRTASGNFSVTQQWLEDQGNELTESILRVRKLNKIIGTFIDSMRTIQDELLLGEAEQGMVHGEFNIFGTNTGRFSSSNPNLQQIPKRDPEFYEVCRSMFIAGKGRKLIAADYSNQEQRIQVHYGKLVRSGGAAEVAIAWNDNPELDFHQKVADICGIDRRSAKTINLGKSYGMGDAKLCKKLGLPTRMQKVVWKGKEELREVAGEEGQEIINKYNLMMPFIKELTDTCRTTQKERGYIKSLAGRHLHPEVFLNEKKYFKAFNQLIQGSAADMTIRAITKLYEAISTNYSELDIKLVGCVHDELIFSVPENTLENSLKLIRHCMEHAFELEVPTLVDIQIGASWYAQ